MGEGNSPYFAAGVEDAERDAGLVGSCPPWPAIGPDPEKEWSVMYIRGYVSVPIIYHYCDKSCTKGAA